MNKIGNLIARVATSPAQATLVELFDIFDLPAGESTLAKIALVEQRLTELGLVLLPGTEKGELDTVRTIRFPIITDISEEAVLENIRRREDSNLELKSSLLYDHDKARFNPALTASELKSDGVLYSVLKTICAFLTCGGGVLYIGVSNEAVILGIEYDFPCITDKKERQNSDGWELHLRNHIGDKFKDGTAINDYIGCTVLSVTGKLLARLDVSPRGRLSYLKQKDGYTLFRRQGNRSVEVKIDEVEEFVETRRVLRS